MSKYNPSLITEMCWTCKSSSCCHSLFENHWPIHNEQQIPGNAREVRTTMAVTLFTDFHLLKRLTLLTVHTPLLYAGDTGQNNCVTFSLTKCVQRRGQAAKMWKKNNVKILNANMESWMQKGSICLSIRQQLKLFCCHPFSPF